MDWSAGYYLNNAYFRLQQISKELNAPILKKRLSNIEIADLQDNSPIFVEGLEMANLVLKEIDKQITQEDVAT